MRNGALRHQYPNCNQGGYRNRQHQSDAADRRAYYLGRDEFPIQDRRPVRVSQRYPVERQYDRHRGADIGEHKRIDERADVFAPDTRRAAEYDSAREMGRGLYELFDRDGLSYRRIVENAEKTYDDASQQYALKIDAGEVRVGRQIERDFIGSAAEVAKMNGNIGEQSRNKDGQYHADGCGGRHLAETVGDIRSDARDKRSNNDAQQQR